MSLSLNDIFDELKKLTLKREQDFSIPINFFFDNVADNPYVKKKHKPFKKKKEFYRALLQPALQHQGSDVTITAMYLMSLEKFHLVHGSVILSNGKSAMLYFLTDIKAGMVAISKIGSNTDMYRLSVFEGNPTSDSPNVSTNTSTTLH